MQQTNSEETLQHPSDRATEPGLLVGERRHRIVDLLNEQGRVMVEALASRFVTSAVTIRNDWPLSRPPASWSGRTAARFCAGMTMISQSQ